MKLPRRMTAGAAAVTGAATLVAGALTPTGVANGAAAGSGVDPAIPGFTAAHSRSEHRWETAYLPIPSTGTAQQLDAYLSRRPGLLGTPGDWRRVQYVMQTLRSYGLQPEVHTYYPYLSVPRHIAVSETAPRTVVASNKEPRQPWEHDYRDVVVGYNALSPSGDVTAPAVYVNYGTIQDYAQLAKRHISVRGKIVIARYGEVFRGVKTNLAAEHGAIGVVLYSDPADDGYTQGKVYPNGPWRNAQGIQRGSIQQLWLYGGDPLTPGWAATRDAARITPSRANLGKIPTAPIGYGSARPMLADLAGPKAPKSWQGGLPLTYHIGPGPTALHLDLKIDYAIKPIWDVTARIPGREHPNQVVYVGAHRDTWTYGSDDNLSGSETVLQIGRGLGRLLQQGWRPNRSIVLSTWDGEEYGLYGSTEYAEQQGMRRLDRVVSYVNLDIAAGRDFAATGVPSLDQLVYDTTKLVRWPGTNTTIYGAWSKQSGAAKPAIARLGSGSDYTAFFDHFGVSSVEVGSETPSGDYHCACDNYYMETHFIDPGWRYHRAIAQLTGLITMRLSDADVAQLQYAPYANEVQRYLRAFRAAQLKRLGHVVVDVQRDIRQAQAWARAAAALQARVDALLRADNESAFTAVNAKLMADERDLLTQTGLPGRPWYRHQIYAPGVDSGYAPQPLPGLHDALFLRHSASEARSYEARLYQSLREATATLRN